jgi:hypothetical protein
MHPPVLLSSEEQLRRIIDQKKQLYLGWDLVASRDQIDPERIVYDGGSYVVLADRTRLDIAPDRHKEERELWFLKRMAVPGGR